MPASESLGWMMITFIGGFAIVSTTLLKDDPKALISLSDSSKLKVTLTCDTKFIKVQLLFNMTSFRDWIVIGNSQNERCRVQGNGDVTYVMQLPLMGDGCGTKMSEPGTFENMISIRSNPLLILQGDEVVTIKCAYGPPEIGSPVVPLLPTSPQPAYIDRATETVTVAGSPDVKISGMPVGYIYLIVFLVLFLALLFLICGCLYFFLKRRKVRVERKKRLMLTVPHGSELSKIHFGGLWWPGKNSPHNDTLLSQDYMVSTNSTREQLSVTTEYAGETPSTSSGDSPEAPHQGYRNKALMHDVRQMIPRVHTDHMAIRNLPVINSLQSIPEENVGVLRLDSDSLRKGTDSSSLHGPLYAPLDKGVKDLHSRHLNLMNPKLDLGKSQITMISDIRSQMRSTTEIYSLPPDQMDNDSISTLEGQQYVSQTRMPAGNQQVAVDIHTTPESHYQCPTGSLSEAKTTVAENHRVIPIDQIDWHQYIQAVENNCGFGPKKLNQEDLDIWRHLVTNDRNMKSLIATAKSIEDFELISHHPQFSDLYSREKWAIIIQSLAHVAFMQRLSDIIENKKTSDGGSEASNSGIGDKEKRANRIFTRESYYRVRDEMESMSSGDEMTLQLDYYSHLPPPIESVHSSSSELSNQNAKTPEQQRMSPEQKITPKLQLSTSKVSNASNTFIRERSTSECFEHPPTLSVYVGNVSGRANASDPYQSGPMDYYGANGSSLGSFQSQINGNSANIRSAKELDKF